MPVGCSRRRTNKIGFRTRIGPNTTAAGCETKPLRKQWNRISQRPHHHRIGQSNSNDCNSRGTIPTKEDSIFLEFLHTENHHNVRPTLLDCQGAKPTGDGQPPPPNWEECRHLRIDRTATPQCSAHQRGVHCQLTSTFEREAVQRPPPTCHYPRIWNWQIQIAHHHVGSDAHYKCAPPRFPEQIPCAQALLPSHMQPGGGQMNRLDGRTGTCEETGVKANGSAATASP